MSHEHHEPAARCSCTTDHRRHGWRSRWAAVGAVLTIIAGVGGVSWAGATNSQVTPSTTSISPCRIMDTRASSRVGPRSTPLGSDTTHTIQVTGTNGNCSIPSNAASVLVNVTVVDPGTSGFITVFPGGSERPTASNLNYTVGQSPVPNLVNAALGATGQLSFYALGGPVDLVADITGFTTSARMTASQIAQNRWDKDLAKPATIDVAGISEAQSGVAFDGTSIWVAGGVASGVRKVDVAGSVVNRTVSVGSNPFGVAYDGTSIWVTNSGSDNVSKINPTTNTVTATVNVGDSPREIAFDGTSIWVTNLFSSNVSKVNPNSNTVTVTVNVGTAPTGVAFDGSSIWVTNIGADTISKVNPANSSVTATISVGDGPNGVAFDGTSIWVTNFFGNTVSKVDPATNSVTATISVASGPRGVAFDGTSIWVTSLGGTVSKLRAG